MPSGTEYAKLYRKANTAYCQGNLEDAAVIVKEMISKYPEDANVMLLQAAPDSTRFTQCRISLYTISLFRTLTLVPKQIW